MGGIPKKSGNYTKDSKNFYTTPKVTDAGEVKQLVTELIKAMKIDGEDMEMIWILTGTHGTEDGDLVAERKFFWDEDKSLEAQSIKAVDVFKFSKYDKKTDSFDISKNSWNKYLGKKGYKILAWCFSEQSKANWMKDAGLKV